MIAGGHACARVIVHEPEASAAVHQETHEDQRRRRRRTGRQRQRYDAQGGQFSAFALFPLWYATRQTKR